MKQEELQKILRNHRLWLNDEGGERANLSDADLRDADLSYVNLRNASLICADLSGASLICADLRDAYLRGADLRGSSLICADLSGASLINADLRDAYLSGANLSDADLRGANLSGVRYNENTGFFALQCPEEGSFVAWKKCMDGVLVKLLIPEDAKRSSATTRKCRASKAIVLEVIGAGKGVSQNDKNFIYEVGKEMIPDSFDDDRWNECSNGIHFFITRKEAENY